LGRIAPPESALTASIIPAQADSIMPTSILDSSNGPELDEEEMIEWEESDREDAKPQERRHQSQDVEMSAGGELQPRTSNSMSTSTQNTYAKIIPPPPQKPIEERFAEQEETGFDEETIRAVEEDIYSDPEDEDLIRQLAMEAEEHARFALTLNTKSQLQNAEDYERELRQLRTQQKKDRRDADEVTHVMVTECQQLLKLFGLPYITAPMEAEAQCAELVSLGLVDGIVTDDSDIFLFGGTRVYKNMFNQAKFVECYLSSDLEKEYSLDRKKIIQIAHLLGSDYTEGLPNVGPVTALEILSEFENLEQFRVWWSKVQMGEKLPEDDNSPFRKKFKRNATKIFLPPAFPDKRVDEAYLHPEVDSDPSAFAWGVPDLDALRQFLMVTIGWNQERADEILVPVIRDMNRRENEGTQANITQFFSGAVGVGANTGTSSGAFAPRRRGEGKSKRMENALGRLHERAKERTIGEGEASVEQASELEAAPQTEGSGTKKRKTRNSARVVASDSEDSADNEGYSEPSKSKMRGKLARKA
jgi:DNA excision repair protein ERCC-5